MELRELIGARLAVGIPGTEADEGVINALKKTQARSLVVFSRNAASPTQRGGRVKPLRTNGCF